MYNVLYSHAQCYVFKSDLIQDQTKKGTELYSQAQCYVSVQNCNRPIQKVVQVYSPEYSKYVVN